MALPFSETKKQNMVQHRKGDTGSKKLDTDFGLCEEKRSWVKGEGVVFWYKEKNCDIGSKKLSPGFDLGKEIGYWVKKARVKVWSIMRKRFGSQKGSLKRQMMSDRLPFW